MIQACRRGIVRFLVFASSDRCLMAVVAIVTALIGMAMQFVWKPDNYMGQPSGWHVVSVGLASGQGLTPLPMEKGSKLEAFLYHRTKAISLDEVPRLDHPFRPGGFERTHQYLFYLLGAVWWLFGISWNAVDILLVVSLCITALILYGLFRLGMNRFLSVVGALLFVSTPLMYSNLQAERDFLKAPFILGSILIMGCLATKAQPKWRFIGLAAGLGLVMGIGLGFRQDLALCLVPAVVVLVCCPRRRPGWAIGQRCLAIAVMSAAWFVAAFPILSVMQSGQSQTFHSMTGGLGCDAYLAIRPGSYRLLQSYLDQELSQSYSSYTTRTRGDPPTLEFFTADAERRAKLFILEAVKTYPADFINRAYAAALYILDAPWNGGFGQTSPSRPMTQVNRLQRALSEHWQGCRAYYLLAVCLLLGLADRRTAWIAAFIVLYFCCSTALQFQPRHVFHLCFLPLWFMGFVVDKVFLAARFGLLAVRARAWRTASISSKPLVRMAGFALGLGLVIFVPLYASRAYQHLKVGALLPRYRAAALEPVATEMKTAGATGFVSFSPLNWPKPDYDMLAKTSQAAPGAPQRPYLRTEYLVAEFETDATGFRVGLEYETGMPYPQLTTDLKVDGARQPVRVKLFMPLYETVSPPNGSNEWTRFIGIRLSEKNAGAFKGLYRVANPNDFRLLPTLILPDELSYFSYYHTLPDTHTGQGLS